MLKLFFLFFIPSLYLQAQIQNYSIMPNKQQSGKFMRINILDSKELKFDKFNDIKITEISALAFNNGKLYALSDKGFLYHFNLKIKNNQIKSFKVKNALRLKNKKYEDLKGKDRDSEGLVFLGDSLLISFERNHRVELFTLNGVKINTIKINKDLENKNNYRDTNKGLEAVAYSDVYGVVTAPEEPLKNQDVNYHTLYAKNRTWKFKASGSITALEFINKNEILVLQRSFNKLTFQMLITLSKVYLDKCKDGICQHKILAELDNKKGWRIDNFEGLTKVSDNKYLIVSDDNENIFQKTLLVLFEILD